jgi:hypothetical protein
VPGQHGDTACTWLLGAGGPVRTGLPGAPRETRCGAPVFDPLLVTLHRSVRRPAPKPNAG